MTVLLLWKTDVCKTHKPPVYHEIDGTSHPRRRLFHSFKSAIGMPPPWVYEGADGQLVLYNEATRATRIAKLSPGTFIRVEVIGRLPVPVAKNPKVGEKLP
jgi:hypothetical protein